MNHLGQLHELHRDGVLTDAEFEAAKDRLPVTSSQEDTIALIDELHAGGYIADDEAEVIRGRALNRHAPPVKNEWKEHENTLTAALANDNDGLARMREMLAELRSQPRSGAVRANARRVPKAK